MAAFNFEVFEADFKQRRLLQDVADLFGALRNPEDPNERLLPVEPGDPLHNFMQKLRIDETPILILSSETPSQWKMLQTDVQTEE
jgi:hypothetical protein